jgi:alkanesulfonate monooxygenase SsuD/methylene tetrahydromethanopterin reductase-like flavin-dependent oxidoreductase (luciferase family)
VRVGLMQEGHCPPGTTWPQRYHEMLTEAVAAERAGFDFYGVGEQHFGKYTATVSSPEVFNGHVLARTERLRIRPMSVNMLPFNHPIRIAEQTATLDVLSNGRAELGGARSNNLWTLQAFGIDPTQTREYRDEILEIVALALTSDPFEYHGRHFDIPERRIAPRPIQQPCPPIHLSATGVASHSDAARRGVGVMTGNTILGWEYAQSCIDAYRDEPATETPIAGVAFDRLAMVSTVVACAERAEDAFTDAAPVADLWMDIVAHIYSQLSEESPDYAYMGNFRQVQDRRHDLGYLVECAPYFTIGTPDVFIERAHQLHAMGVDDLVWRIDGMGHQANLRSIEMLGKHVLPAIHALPEHQHVRPTRPSAP